MNLDHLATIKDPHRLLRRLWGNGLDLAAGDDGSLRVEARIGAVTAELRVFLAERKQGLLSALAYVAHEAASKALREAFVRDFDVKEIKFSRMNLCRMLNLTGERPERVEEMRAILGALGLGDPRSSWIGKGGVFDHGDFFGREGKPWALVGHPYGISREERGWFAELARFTVLRVCVDDRPSYYGFGTNHVRVEMPEARKRFKSIPSTRRTAVYARAARAVIAAELAGDV